MPKRADMPMGGQRAERRSRAATAACVLVLAPPFVEAQSTAAAAVPVAPQALAQIEALLAEKSTRTGAEKKVSSRLLHAARLGTGRDAPTAVSSLRLTLPTTAANVVLDVRGGTPTLLPG